MDGDGWSWVEVDGVGWSWVHGLVIPFKNTFFVENLRLLLKKKANELSI